MVLEPGQTQLVPTGIAIHLDDPGLAAQVLVSVGDVPLRMVSQAASRRNITFVIREVDLPAALGRVHDTFFAAQPSLAGSCGGQAISVS